MFLVDVRSVGYGKVKLIDLFLNKLGILILKLSLFN